MLRVWTCKTFRGHNPVGTAAVIVARDRSMALALLKKALRDASLWLDPDNTDLTDKDLVELRLDTEAATILCDGEY